MCIWFPLPPNGSRRCPCFRNRQTVTRFNGQLDDHEFECFRFKERQVWYGGSGPPVILMHEIDGFGPPFVSLLNLLADDFEVYAPLFYGQAGKGVSNAGGFVRVCLSREFTAFRLGKTSSMADWVRRLAEEIKKRKQTAKVGIVGMCLTGGLVLATITEPCIAAAVAAQPSLPFALPCSSTRRKQDIGMSDQDIERAAMSKTPVLTLRFGADCISPARRVENILQQIPSAIAPPDYLKGIDGHPTLTGCYRSELPEDVKELSKQTITETIAFLKQHLAESAPHD